MREEGKRRFARNQMTRSESFLFPVIIFSLNFEKPMTATSLSFSLSFPVFLSLSLHFFNLFFLFFLFYFFIFYVLYFILFFFYIYLSLYLSYTPYISLSLSLSLSYIYNRCILRTGDLLMIECRTKGHSRKY